MSDVRIETIDGRTYLISPYNPAMPPRAKAIGGRWDAGRKAWRFDARDEDRVAALAREIYGTDGRTPADTDLVTVRVPLYKHEVSSGQGGHAEFAGRKIAWRPGRDADVCFASGVVLVAGTLTGRGGSVRYPAIEADLDVIVEIRDLPRAALSVESEDSYEIVDQTVDVDALLAERERLLARLAEIEELLPEPEGAEVSAREAAAALRISVRTVQRWATAGKVEARKDGTGRWIITITI